MPVPTIPTIPTLGHRRYGVSSSQEAAVVPGDAYRAAVLADSPTAYYRLGEPSGTVAADEVGAHAGTYVNAPTLGVAGGVTGNTAITVASASSQRVDLTTLGALGGSLTTICIEFWVKTSTASTLVALMGSSATVVCTVWLNTGNTIAGSAGVTAWQLRGANSNTKNGSISTAIYDGAWHHVVWVNAAGAADTNPFTCWVDGVSRTVTMQANTLAPTGGNFTQAMMLGARNLAGAANLYSNASIDEVAFYPAALSSGRIAAHYAARNT